MPKHELGTMKLVNIHEVFDNENTDFTPWLNANLNFLSEKLGIEMLDSKMEDPVGRYNCDISAKEANSQRVVVIENQYGTTDHDHLGKIFTYAAGKQAGIVVWIAESFREEHKKTLEWLNDNVNPESGPSFFGIEFRLLRIGDSPPAPYLDIVVQPNEWERAMNTPSGTSMNYLEFFSALIEKYSQANPSWRRVKPQPQQWVGFGAGRTGLAYNWSFRSRNRLSIELYINTDRDENKRIFDELRKAKDKIDAELPGLSWERLDDQKASRIAVYKDVGANIRSLQKDSYPEVVGWAADMMGKFTRALGNYVKNLPDN